MTPDMRQVVHTVIKQKWNADIDCSNKYVFATRGSGHVNVWTALNECAIAAGCTNPELVSVTRLRKYVSTISQVSIRKRQIRLQFIVN